MITTIPPMPDKDYAIHGIFPDPVYRTIRKPEIDSTEEKEIEELIKEELVSNRHNSRSKDSYIFNTRLKKLKEFCEGHIKTYVKEVHNPKKDNNVNFYITQSWLNITKPGEWHHQHWHSNSIISGVYYVATVENDEILFYDSNAIKKDRMELDIAEEDRNIWNSKAWYIPVEKNVLVLFPSWLEHSVEENKKQTTDRISISFNTFTKGRFGSNEQSNELIL